MSTSPAQPELVETLAQIVGEAHLYIGADRVAPFVTDWTRRFGGPCLAVVRPGGAGEIAEILRACAAAGVPVLPQGGNTGLVGGSVPAASGQQPPVIISLLRLTGLGAVDDLAGQVTVGAGATLGEVQRHAVAAGWRYGVDLAARDSATIGGTVATNAGGIHVIAHGMTRAQVVGIEVVLADGSVISHLSGMLKDNTGYDLAGLFCGSEGTLGIITAVRLKLHRPLGRTTVTLVGTASYADALALMSRAGVAAESSAPGSRLLAAEVIDAPSMDLVCAVADLNWPLAQRWPVVVLLEVVDGGDGSGLPLDETADAVVAFDAADQARLWAYRERQADAYGAAGIVHKLDVSAPLPKLAACADELMVLIGTLPDVTTFGIFGHLADGNMHVEIVGPAAADLRADLAVLECVASYGGSISAEHGVGRAKAADLHLCRSATEIAAMRAIKGALDPQGLMNPGVLFI